MTNTEAQTLPLSLGQQFAAARRKAGHDQTALGHILGCDRTTISRWERDQAEPPFSAVAKLSEMSGWPLALFARAAGPDDPSDTPDGQGVPPTIWKENVLPFPFRPPHAVDLDEAA